MGPEDTSIGYRIGYNYTWSSHWYADKDYARLLHQDLRSGKWSRQTPMPAWPRQKLSDPADQTSDYSQPARPDHHIGRKGARSRR